MKSLRSQNVFFVNYEKFSILCRKSEQAISRSNDLPKSQRERMPRFSGVKECNAAKADLVSGIKIQRRSFLTVRKQHWDLGSGVSQQKLCSQGVTCDKEEK